MKIADAFQELQTEKAQHKQTMGMLREVSAAYYQLTGENFRFTNWPNDPRPSFLRRLGRVVWPLKIWVA
jgi:hypothetical protein